MPLADGDEREALSWARTMTPDLWHEGLAEYALILALIAIVAIIALLFLGGAISKVLSTVGSSV